jgi:hypothetical protein
VAEAYIMKKILQGEYLVIILLIAINLAIGIATLPDYGESWDEARLYEYGDQSINAYRALFNPAIAVDFGDDDLRYYGPAYFMGMSMIVRTLHATFPNTLVIDLWHIGNFLCFQLGLLFFYFLLRRFIGTLPSITTTALLASQPILWGHGFINPKDIPFMAFFTASVYLGLKMMDQFQSTNFEIKRLPSNPWFYMAAVSLGLTISIRILGFAAAGIVLVYLTFFNFRKVLRLSYAYFGLALIVSFLTWPYLWPAPIANFIKGIYAMLKFQWVGHVLFNGIYYPSNQLPRAYVPQLLVMQLSEGALILFVIGMAALFTARIRENYKTLYVLFAIWFVVPLLYILINGMNLYDNTRQLFFIYPGLFLAIAIGLDVVFKWIKPSWAKALVIVFILLPGAVGVIKYHPYEYTYYNYLTTTRQSIFRNFETDYWATSFKDVTLYLNEHAPKDSLVIVWGPGQLVRRYAREDIQVKSFDEVKDNSFAAHPYYLILTTRYDMDRTYFPEIEPIYTVKHNDVDLAVVRYITPQK